MTESMTQRELDEIMARLDGVTPGLWLEDGYGDMIWAENPYGKGKMWVVDVRGWGHLTGRGDGGCAMPDEQAMAIQHANAQFIAHARTDIPDLYAENSSLRAELLRVTQELEAAKRNMWTMRSCQNCKHCPGNYPALHGACKNCDDEDKWEWRGLVPDNTQAGGETGDEARGGGEG